MFFIMPNNAHLGAFIIVYFIAMVLFGIPLFFQEIALGQYLESGGMTLIGHLCPLLKGYKLICALTSNFQIVPYKRCWYC